MHPHIEGALIMGGILLAGAAWRTWEHVDARRADWQPGTAVLTERHAEQAIAYADTHLDSVDTLENVKTQACYQAVLDWARDQRHRGSLDRQARIEALAAEARLSRDVSQPQLRL